MPSQIPDGDIVVLIPGILGSTLSRDGRQTWGYRQIGRSLHRLGRKLTEDLTLGSEAYLDSVEGFNDGTTVTGVLRTKAILPGLVAVHGYDRLASALRNRLHAQPFEVIEYPYDWRQSNRVAAHRLQREVEPLIRSRRTNHPDAGLVLVGHSMGGLVARYFAEVLDTDRFVKRVITIGTPYRGAVDALAVLGNGFTRIAGRDVQIGELARSMPSVAELLPSFPCIGSDVQNLSQLSNEMRPAGLPQRALEHGLEFHREVSQRSNERGRADIYRVVLGYLQPTNSWASTDDEGRIVSHASEHLSEQGDGTVPVLSAFPPEWSDRSWATASSAGRHSTLHQSPEVIRQLVFLITSWESRSPMGADDELSVSAPHHAAVGDNWIVEAFSALQSDSLALEMRLHVDSPTASGSSAVVVPLRPDPAQIGRYSASIAMETEGLHRWEIASVPHSTKTIDSLEDLVLCTVEA